MEHFFSRVFITAYNDRFRSNYHIAFPEQDLKQLDIVLEEFIHKVIGFRFNNGYDLSEVRTYFDNICRHLDLNRNLSLVEAIRKYQDEYLKLVESHYYTKLFIEVVKRIYSEDYDGKLLINSTSPNRRSSANVAHFEDFLVISKHNRQGELIMPAVKINRFDRFEEILEEYISIVKSSNTFYNIFNNPNFDSFTEEEKIKMIFEGTIFNAGNYEFASVEKFFDKYSNFILDSSFDRMHQLTKIGDAFDDEMYFAVKRSSIEYETPNFFSFMLKNHRLELPNTRLAISQTQKGKKAYIMATQSSQITPHNEEVSEMIKRNIPKSSKFRSFNPDHFVSNLLTFGVLNGMGIHDIEVSDYMPLRCYKTVKDKKMSETEAQNYITRVVDKNVYTYFKLSSICEGIEITSVPDGGQVLSIHLDETIKCPNEFLMNLYNIAYEYGKANQLESIENKSSKKC